jgi:DNA-binding MarR family transcriptional regulator
MNETLQAVRLFWQLDHLLIRWARRYGDPPFTVSTFLALDLLDRDLSLSMKEIAQALEITPASTTALAGRLEARGWAQRQPDPDDQRMTRLHLCDAGRDALQSYYDLMARFFDDALTMPQVQKLSSLMALLAGSHDDLQGPVQEAVHV